MNDSVKAVWSELTQHVAARWQISATEAPGQMVAIIRHAVFDPALALVISTAGLLQMSLPPAATTEAWVNCCAAVGKEWLQQYRLLEHRCTQKYTAVPEACYCILNQLAPLFANSHSLLVDGQALVAQLPPEAQDEAYDMLLRALTRLARISTELDQGDLTWLWEYIDTKVY